MERIDLTAAAPRRTSYERRPASPEVSQMPLTVSAVSGIAMTLAAFAVVMLADAERRWLWIAVLLGAVVFLVMLIWRLQVQDGMSIYERETTVEQPGAAIRPTVTEGTRGSTIYRGNFTMRREYWQRLYDLAQDGRRITRDAVVSADAMPRELYHAVFDETTAEMRRVGLLDDENRMTAAWRQFHREYVETGHERRFVRSGSTNGAGSASGVGGSG